MNTFIERLKARMIVAPDHGETASSRAENWAAAIALLVGSVGLLMAFIPISDRSSISSTTATNKELSMPLSNAKGMVDVPSKHSVDQTVDRLKEILKAKGVTLFAVIDHSGEAEKAGMKMPPTKLLIFGSPKAGTPVMVAAPSSAIDLPLKILIWEDNNGKVWVSYNSAEHLKERHGIPQELLPNIAVVEALATKAAE